MSAAPTVDSFDQATQAELRTFLDQEQTKARLQVSPASSAFPSQHARSQTHQGALG